MRGAAVLRLPVEKTKGVTRVRHRGPICHLVPYIFVERRYRSPRIVTTFACRRFSICCITCEIDNAKLWGRGHPPPYGAAQS
jgi:hypothetical protein